MSQAKNKPWLSRWRELGPLGRGGQGTTSLVESLNADEQPGQYVLKVLHSQKDPERRGRMYREVAALKTLDNPGVPRVIDSNADEYEDSQRTLYIVTEYINGLTLEASVSSSRLSIADAVALLMRLTDIVSYCHDRGVVHRDIKPDNIVLRGNSVSDPVLLDFGQSFNWEALEESPLTDTGQQLGNRFITLPELQLNSGNQRDGRSDLTQLCGLLFFALSGHYPVMLLDSDGRMPHQRPAATEAFSRFPRAIHTQLNRLFDTAFTVALDQRFQSAQALRAALRSLGEPMPGPQTEDTEQIISSLRDKLTGPRFAEQQQIRMLFQTIDRKLTQSRDLVSQGLGGATMTVQSGHSLDIATLTYGNSLGLQLANKSTYAFMPRFTAKINGSEVVVTAIADGTETELFRAASAGVPPWENLVESATRYFANGIAKKCEDV